MGLDEAVEHFELGGFARAVAADEADAFARFSSNETLFTAWNGGAEMRELRAGPSAWF